VTEHLSDNLQERRAVSEANMASMGPTRSRWVGHELTGVLTWLGEPGARGPSEVFTGSRPATRSPAKAAHGRARA